MNTWEVSDVAVYGAEIVVKASLLLGLAALLGLALRRRFPSGAHLVWVLAFCALIAIPVVATLVPWKPVLFLNIKSPAPLHVRRGTAHDLTSGQSSSTLGSALKGQSDPGTSVVPTDNGRGLTESILQSPVLSGLFLFWLIGFLAVAARSIHGLYCLRVIRRFGTNPVSSERLAFEADRLAKEAGQLRAFDLRISATPELPVPMTWGVIRPTIVLPIDAISWSDTRFEATLLHELSHVRRCDFFSQLLAEFACALYWFNPLVWLSAGAMRSDAELAADDAVVHAGLKPSDYAKELLLLAADLGKRPIPFSTLGTHAMTNSKIETRLESILSPAAGRRGVTSVQVLAALALTVVAIPTFASLHASASPQAGGDGKEERNEAMMRAKQMGLATIMYTMDYDNDFPYVQQTASAVQVLQPYSKNLDWYKSPTKGGKFSYNLNIAGVNTTAIENPKTVPIWIESLPDPTMSYAVVFVDGHAQLIGPDNHPAIKKAAAKKYKRAANMNPLPFNYLLPDKP